jgi:hypothetical protein
VFVFYSLKIVEGLLGYLCGFKFVDYIDENLIIAPKATEGVKSILFEISKTKTLHV